MTLEDKTSNEEPRKSFCNSSKKNTYTNKSQRPLNCLEGQKKVQEGVQKEWEGHVQRV